MKKLPWILVILLAVACVAAWFHPHEPLSVDMRPDTTNYVDTIPFYYPVPRESIVVRYETVKLPIKKDTCSAKGDTCAFPVDSVQVEIPITSKVYEDSLYHLWVSGYNVRLDSINVYSRLREIRIPIPAKKKRWGIGLQVGYNYPGGFYVGGGISWNLFVW
ncbi:DUF6808 domain-containing protein [Bacteroides cellulosilyticus]|uniref:DUF6808 domain-containing protein n=1 Tax=Bacteroides cellulosilyticus TaxID=246787 RepID=UPI00189937AA|nr:hypothetical protein [Bacteroides cellulosilyticus]